MSVLTPMKFVSDDIKLLGTVVREEIVVPPGNKLLGIGCHIIQLPAGDEIAVPNMRINLSRHIGRKVWYESQKDPTLPGCRYRVVSKPNV